MMLSSFVRTAIDLVMMGMSVGFRPWIVDDEQQAAEQQQPNQQACDDLGLDLKSPTGDLFAILMGVRYR